MLFDQALWLLMQKRSPNFLLTFQQILLFYEGLILVSMLQRPRHSKLNDQICMQSDTSSEGYKNQQALTIQVRLHSKKYVNRKEFKQTYLRKYCSSDSSNLLSFFFPYNNFLFSISSSAKCGPLRLVFSVSLCNFCTKSEAFDIRESNCTLEKKLDYLYARNDEKNKGNTNKAFKCGKWLI